jgi:hypothetical protein
MAGPKWLRVALAAVVACVFFIQNFIAQTHIHGVPAAAFDSAVTVFTNTGDDGAPYDPFLAAVDPVNQIHSGNYSSPGAALLVQPVQRIAHVAVLRETRGPDFTLSHVWQSRAPPGA